MKVLSGVRGEIFAYLGILVETCHHDALKRSVSPTHRLVLNATAPASGSIVLEDHVSSFTHHVQHQQRDTTTIRLQPLSYPRLLSCAGANLNLGKAMYCGARAMQAICDSTINYCCFHAMHILHEHHTATKNQLPICH